jgi:molybdate transport system substrate-binding protein
MLICRSLFRKTDRIIPLLFVFLFFSLATPPFAVPADRKLTAAVVAGFMSPFQEIAAAFEKETGISIDVSFTSAGRIYAQIENGAPYDIFLSADVERPALLYGKSLCEKPFVYAEGEVILWSADRRFCTSAGWQEALQRKEIQKIAIPNPQTAVHGTHAKKALEEAGLWKDLAPKLVVAQDIAQVFQYATIGAVDGAFCSSSHARTPPGQKGCFYTMNEAAPVVYSACVLSNSSRKDEARRFAEFLRSPAALQVKNKYGYRETPKSK